MATLLDIGREFPLLLASLGVVGWLGTILTGQKLFELVAPNKRLPKYLEEGQTFIR